jgi:glutathione S-transferase
MSGDHAIALYAAVPESVPVMRCSPPSWAAQIALIEEAVPHEVHWLRFDQGEHRSDAMLALSPAGTVPLLVDGVHVVTDTIAILEHIVGASTSRTLAPASAARVEQARAVKDAGMRAFRSMMQGAREAWDLLADALDRFVATPGAADAFDFPAVLVFAYVETARSLGFRGTSPAIGALLEHARQRPSVITTRPRSHHISTGV